MSRPNKKPIATPVNAPQVAPKTPSISTESLGFWQNAPSFLLLKEHDKGLI